MSFLISVGLLLAFLVGCTSTPAGAKPVAGGFQGGNKPIADGGTFLMILVVFENDSNVINSIDLACAPQGKVTLPITVAKDVKIEGGKFKAEYPEVIILGEFVSSTQAKGTIRALTEDAKSCGIPEEATWVAQCNMSVEKKGDGYALASAKSGPCAQP
jgi:hypothetical protein